jgi:hypothetical protein
MAKSLFTEYEKYTNDANNLDDDVQEALQPILDKYLDKGYTVREIEYIMLWSVNEIGLKARM